MQQTGSLKKRRKRNLTKVAGLGVIPYDPAEDTLEDFYVGKTFEHTKNNKNHGVGINRGNEGESLVEVQVDTPHGIMEYKNYWGNEDKDEVDGLHLWDTTTSTPPTNLKKDNDLSYLLSLKTVTRMRSLIILGSTSLTFPWSWNWKTYRIDEWSPVYKKIWRCLWALYTIQTSCLLLFQIYTFGKSISAARQAKSYRGAFQSSFSFCLYCYCIYFNINMYLFKDAIRQYVNTMFAMNKVLVDKYVISLHGYEQRGRVLIDWSIPTNTCQVFTVTALFCSMPYAPWFLYHYIYTPELPWWYRIPGAIHEYTLMGQVISSFMFDCWVVYAHTSTVRFWLQEIHLNNDSEYTTTDLRIRRNAMKVFQSLQILCTLFNDCMGPMSIPAVKIHIASALIPCGYILINSFGSIFLKELPGVLCYPVGVFNTVSAGLVVLSLSAEMFDLSVSFVDSWSRTKHKDFRRLLKSFPTLKVKVGRFYIITVSTTITFFKTITDYIIDSVITF